MKSKTECHSIAETERFFQSLVRTIPLSPDDPRMVQYMECHPDIKRETVHGYVVPRCEENEWLYQREKEYHERYLAKKRAYFREHEIDREVYSASFAEFPEILFFFDEPTGQISAQNGGEDVLIC